MKSLYSIILLCISTSCSFLCTPQSYDSITGKHCIVLMTLEEVDLEKYKQICSIADDEYEDVIRLTDLDFTAKIVITHNPEDSGMLQYPGLDDYSFADNNSVYLNTKLYESSLYEIKRVLIHELTHVFTIAYFGPQESFLFSEGIAVYTEDRGMDSENKQITNNIEEILSISYHDLYFYTDELYDSIDNLYVVSSSFVKYWCETFGMDNFFALYRDVNTSNYKEMIEKHSKKSFDRIISDFKFQQE